jgi:AcrR family transcriptional regulator
MFLTNFISRNHFTKTYVYQNTDQSVWRTMTEHQDKDMRREQILEAATRLFVDKGFENSSVDEIAKEAGLSKGTIYWYFKSKFEILFAITDHCTAESQCALRMIAESGKWGPEMLYKSHRALNESHILDETHDRVFHQLGALAIHYPEIREHMLDHYKKWDELTSSLLQRGVDDGSFKPMNTLYLAQAISAMYEGLHVRRILDPTIDVVGILETTMKFVYDALTSPQVASSAERTAE